MRRARATQGVVDTPSGLAQRLARALVGAGECAGVLDPAAGDGALLIAAWRALEVAGDASPDRLFGIECDPGRLADARERLVAELGSDVGARIAANLRLADALDPACAWPAGTSVIANPPWVSYSGRSASPLSQERRRSLTDEYAAFRGWPSLHGAFLERIARHVARERTRAEVLVPASVLELEGYRETRRAVTGEVGSPSGVIELGEGAFPGVVEPTAWLSLTSGNALASTANWIVSDATGDPLVEALAQHPRLPARSFSDPGVHTGNSARQLLLPRSSGAGLPLVREGRDLVEGRLEAPTKCLDTGLERTAERRFRIAPLERYTRVPIVLRQTASRPLAALHTEPTYFRNTLLACEPPPELSPAFVVALLNSEIVGRHHRARFADARQRTFPQVKVKHLRDLPFPWLDSRPTEERRVLDARGPEREERIAAAYAIGRDVLGRPGR